MNLPLVFGAIFCAMVASNPFLAAQTSDAPNPRDHAFNHSGLDGSAYASLEGGFTSEMAASIQKRWFSDPLLKHLEASGTTEIECGVNKEGRLAHVKILQSSGNQSLDDAAVSAAKASDH